MTDPLSDTPAAQFDRYLAEVERDPEHIRRQERIARARTPWPFHPWRAAPVGLALVGAAAFLAWAMGWTKP